MIRKDEDAQCQNDGIETDGREREKYESFICERLHEHGIIAQPIWGRPPGHRCGNLLGIDIIYDPRMGLRGGVYIETHVMEVPPLPVLIRSTLFRDVGAWLYGIGDHELFFIFGKKALRRLISAMDKYFPLLAEAEKIQTATGKGILLPFEQAERLADRTFHFKTGATASLNANRPLECGCSN